jgi:hypothetical protein
VLLVTTNSYIAFCKGSSALPSMLLFAERTTHRSLVVMEKLAIDIGGVVLEKRDLSGPDTNFNLDDVKWVPGALEAVKELVKMYDVYILSFCGKKIEMDTRKALHASELPLYVPEDKWFFTRKREHKILVMKENGIGTLVDDTLQIIEWVNAAGLNGIHFRGPIYKNWGNVLERLTALALSKLKREKEARERASAQVDLSSLADFPPLSSMAKKK